MSQVTGIVHFDFQKDAEVDRAWLSNTVNEDHKPQLRHWTGQGTINNDNQSGPVQTPPQCACGFSAVTTHFGKQNGSSWCD
jgi:hypothetical protein